jgi:MFS family permease
MSSNRWVIALAGTVAMICLGTVYSWSLFTQPLIAAFRWSNTETTWNFALAIFFLGVGAIIGGRWQDRRGPRPVAITGVVLWGVSNILAGLGVRSLGAPWMYLTYGIAGGIGLGLGYVTPVAAVAKWFPERRGFGTGMVVMGFGLGAFIYNNVLKVIPAFRAVASEGGRVLAARAAGDQAAVLSSGSVDALTSTFIWSGIVFAVLGGLCASLVRNPPTPQAVAASSAAVSTPASEDWPPSLAMRTPQFWALWAMLFLNVTAGILFISNAVPIMRELTGVSPAAALAIYGFIALFNGLGRFFWGAVSDRIGRNWAYLLIYGTQVVIFFVVGGIHSIGVVTVLFAIVLLDYGGGFGTMPSFTADYFGTKSMGVNYGWILTAWGVGGIVGPIFVAVVKDRTGSFTGALPIIAVMLLASMILPIVTHRPGEQAGPFYRGLLRRARVGA